MDEPGTWTRPYWGEDIAAWKAAELAAADVQLLGRRTYEGFAAAWPQMERDVFADKMNAMPKYVATTSLTSLTWNAVPVEGDLVVAAKELRDKHTVMVAGSGSVARTLLAAGVVDELRLLLYPVVLGDGHQLLFAPQSRAALTLADAQTFASGVLGLTYTA
jgi:dihydrofolate reductase